MESHDNSLDQSSGISLNCHLQVPTTSAQEQSTRTPNTPEILNSIVNMQQQSGSPFAADFSNASVTSIAESLSAAEPSVTAGPSIEDKKKSPTSIESIRKQFIKEGLKMKVKERSSRSKDEKSPKSARRVSKRISVPVIKIESPEEPEEKPKRPLLTTTDEERRQRRRERNKVAATKCRNKKKARTVLLMKENDAMTAQNANLKVEIARLEAEKKQLMAILSGHEGSCRKNSQGPQEYRFNDLLVSEFPQHPAQVLPDQDLQQQQVLPPISSFPINQGEIKVEMETTSDVDGSLFPITEDPFSSTCGDSSQMDYYYNQAPFLGKGSIGMTYLDLDSRCTLAL